MTILAVILSLSATTTSVRATHLSVRFDVEAHEVRVAAVLALEGEGPLALRLNDAAAVRGVAIDGTRVESVRAKSVDGSGIGTISVLIPEGAESLLIDYEAVFEEDVAAGERPGVIHNHAVQAHVDPAGIFLADGSAWHPHPVEPDGRPVLSRIVVEIEPIEGFALVASGDPLPAENAGELEQWRWITPRGVEGIAIAGARRNVHSGHHMTMHGAVELVMYASPANEALVPAFLSAARDYLDFYVPRLGPFPYRRFTIVEGFFSSGFAFPGFTLLGDRVVAMGPRALRPGYLDHELVHNWWGNGVYVDDALGNWCEALTTYCANYRRPIDEDPAYGLDYRRAVLMRLSTDPSGLDDGPLISFGRPGGAGRFVGYEKGAFVLAMLERELGVHFDDPAAAMWSGLRGFAEAHLGKRATWDDLAAAIQAAAGDRVDLAPFFRYWIHEHHVPRTAAPGVDHPDDFERELAGSGLTEVPSVVDAPGRWYEIDPSFEVYRVLPPAQITPTIGGTLGPGGLRVETGDMPSGAAGALARYSSATNGENILVVGADAILDRGSLIGRTSNPILVEADRFTVGTTTWDGPAQAVLHSMQHPDRPGRFITVFHANGPEGWSHLPLIGFYTRDTTIVWDGDEVIHRALFEPDRRLPLAGE